jgi:hypothetical protein
MNVEAQRVTRWYTGWAFQIDPRQQAATLSNFSAPMIEKTPQGRRRVGPDQTVPRLTVTVPLITARPLGCNDRWVAAGTKSRNPGPRRLHREGRLQRARAESSWSTQRAELYKCCAYQHGATEEELNPRVDGLVNEAPSSSYPPDEGKPCTVGDGVHGYRQGWVRGGFCQVN